MTHKLLLADDSVTIQRVVELTFSGEDVQVVTVGDGEQAIARIPVELPDIVLADIGMPKRSGYEVAAFVKGRPDLSHIPVLLLAGAFEPVDEARAQQVHCDGVLVKPFEPQQVISRVRDLIEAGRSAVPMPARAEPEAKAEPLAARFESPAPRHESPAPRHESPAARHESPAARAKDPESQLDDYFERLDAAFAQLGQEPERHAPPRAGGSEDADSLALPTVEALLGSSGSAESRPSTTLPVELTPYQPAMDVAQSQRESHGNGDASAGGRNLVADMFAALFAVEQGEGAPIVHPPPPRPQTQTPAVTDGLVDEVTRRVVERLAPDSANELVVQIVSEVAERLIREEIARIKLAAGSRQ